MVHFSPGKSYGNTAAGRGARKENVEVYRLSRFTGSLPRPG